MPPKTERRTVDPEELRQTLQVAKEADEATGKKYIGRLEEIEALEDEIIQNYSNPRALKLPRSPDPLRIQEVFAIAQEYLGRVTEIYNGCLKNVTDLRATQQAISDQLLPIVDGASADARKAQVDGIMQTIKFLITHEDGLMDICKTAQTNLRNNEEMASRQLESMKVDLQYFNAAEYIKPLVDESRSRIYGGASLKSGLHGLE